MDLIAKLKSYTLTELGRKSAEVRVAAHKNPVVLTHHGKPDLVVLDHETYEDLVRYQPRARYVSEIPRDELDQITSQPPGTSLADLRREAAARGKGTAA